jgi:integrase
MSGHLEKRGKKSWNIIIETGRDPSTGKRKRLKKIFHGRGKDAEKEMARLLIQIEQGLFVEPTKMSFGVYLNNWLADAKNKLAPKTYLRYKEIVDNNIIQELGQINIEKLKPLHLQTYYNKMIESGRMDGAGGLSTTTVLQHHRIIHKALEMSVKLQILTRNVADAVEPPKKVKQEIRPLSSEQVRVMLEAAEGTPFLPQIAIAVLTGMRRGEIYGLRWCDINFEEGTITVNRAAQYTKEKGVFYKEPKTKRSRRTIAVSQYVMDVLKAFKVKQNRNRLSHGEEYHDREDLVFTQSDGRPQHPDSISSWFPRFVRGIHIHSACNNRIEKVDYCPSCDKKISRDDVTKLRQINFHALRHTHASLLLKSGESLKLICDRLGHGSIGITADTYTHLEKGMQKKAADILEKSIFRDVNEDLGHQMGTKNEKQPPG